MQIRWSPAAASDLQQLFDYIRTENPSAARRVAETIYNRVTALAMHPNQGRSGRVTGTRELALTPLPFIVVYRVRERLDAIEIINVIHGAQRWPPAT
jgi:toxin ParE1/3/4